MANQTKRKKSNQLDNRAFLANPATTLPCLKMVGLEYVPLQETPQEPLFPQ